MAAPTISVLMPTYNQRAFIGRAVRSLLDQSFDDWELLVVDDASDDDTQVFVLPFCTDPRIHYSRRDENGGPSAALNDGLEQARGEFIAYLPSDDVYYEDHLSSLLDALQQNPKAALAYSGVRHHYKRMATGQIPGYSLQMVQVMHRRTEDRWTERETLVSDDLHRLFWHKLAEHGTFTMTEHVTCEWVDHPAQLHKLLREPEGGHNLFRARFNVKHPLRFHSSIGNLIDEVAQYQQFRERPKTPLAEDGLKILLVGELAYNPDRVLALEERGHRLYGLWTREPQWFNTVGPLPFGHVEDVPYEGWRERVEEIAPDVIYALLNWQAVPIAHEVLKQNLGIPFIWHFKEGPFHCLEKGTWPQLVDLYTESNGQIYVSPEQREWFATFLPEGVDASTSIILDGDLPKREWFSDERSAKLSVREGGIHTVVPGRPIGLHPYVMAALAEQDIHVHFYGDYTQGQWKTWIDKVRILAPHHLHLHPHVDQAEWVREFSQYDAGWLHFFYSRNQGEIRRAVWDDLNYPARIATLAAAGLPMIQHDNSGHIVASQTLIEQREAGIVFQTIDELGDKLRERERIRAIGDRVWSMRHQFTFDDHADTLIAFFRRFVTQARLADLKPPARREAPSQLQREPVAHSPAQGSVWPGATQETSSDD